MKQAYTFIDEPYSDAEVVVSNTIGKEVVFNVESILNRRLRDSVNPDTIFTILNSYIEYKGPKFRDELFSRNEKGKNILIEYLTADTYNIPYKTVHNILDMFDINDVKKFIKDRKLVTPPTTLPDQYDTNIDKNERGSREQTYLKEDYYDFIALITILKSTLGIVGEYAFMKSTVLNKNIYKEFILLNFYRSHPIFQTPPFVKLLASISKLVERLFKDSKNTALRIIEQNVSKENLPLHVLALVVIQKLLFNDELSDTDVKNTITKVYSFASDKLKLKNNMGGKFKIRDMVEQDSDSDSESVLEKYRKNSDVTPGYIEEYKVATENVFRLARYLNLHFDDAVIEKIWRSLNVLNEKFPIHECILLASWSLKGIADMRCLDYLRIEHIINILTVGVLWALENDHKQAALIMSSYALTDTGHRVKLSLRNKIRPELKEKLKELFPYEKTAVINGKVSTINYVEETINDISKKLMDGSLVSTLPEDIIEEITGTSLRSIIVPENIRNILAEYIIGIETNYKLRLKEREQFLKQYNLDGTL